MNTTEVICDDARRGDREAYDRLFARYTDRALLFIEARLGPKLRERLDSHDILQEAYLAAHRDFAHFQYTDDAAFFRWLCRIIHNRIRDAGEYHAAVKRQPVELPQSNPTGPATAADRIERQAKI